MAHVQSTFLLTDAGRACKLVLKEDALFFERGAHNREIPWPSLRHLYRHRTSHRPDEGHERLILGFKAANGRQAHEIIHAGPNDSELERAVEAILAIRPEVDRSHLAPFEAYRLIGVATDRQLVIGVAVLVALGTLLTASPSIHRLVGGVDGAYVTIVDARAEMAARVVRIEQSRSGSILSTDTWIPIVANGSGCSRAKLALHLRNPDEDELRRVSLASAFSGGRDVLWEKAPSLRQDQDHAARMDKLLGGNQVAPVCSGELDDEVVAFDPTHTRTSDTERVLFRAFLGFGIGAALIFAQVARSQWRASAASRRRASPYR